MGDNRNLENVKAWISDEAHMQMCLGYGQNEQSVNDALNDQRRRTRMISDYKREVDGAVKNESKDTAAEVEGSYESLSTVSKRRLGCLQDVSKVAGLEALCSELSSNVDDCAYSLVSGEAAAAGDGGYSGQDGDGVARAAQNCIFAFRNNWRWIKTMMQCVDIHLENASAYQQFFHEVKESTQWMSATMKKFEHMFESRDLTGTKPEAQTELANIKEVLRLFVQWQSKVNLIFETAKTIVPVNMRREALEDPWPIRALADYKTKEIEINEGEDLTLLDTSQKTRWRVKNLVNQEALVPAPICLIPPTAPEALEAATNLRFVLLALWTTAVKNIGKQLIFLMQHVFKDFSGNEKNNLKSMTPKQAEEMRRIMKYIQGSLGKVWHGYSEYDTLNSRMDRLCGFVGSNGKEAADPAFINLLMATAGLMEKNQLKYDELFKFWETFKLLLESSRHPRAMLICDKWEQLKFTDIDDILKFWRSDLGLEEGKDDTDASNAKVTQMTEADEDKIRNEATTTEIVTAEQQEKKTFVITGVIDPRNGEEISMQQAVMLGILNQKQGIYVNPDTGETMPFPVAMNSGKIKVGVVSTEKGEEKKSSFGVVTIRTTKESRPYTVTSVLDPETRKEMSLDQAVERGILSETTGVYKDPKTGKEMTLQKAIDAGLLKVEYDNSAPEQGEQTSTKTWAIHSVVDQQEKKKVIFPEAVARGIFDKETGTYIHNVTGEEIFIGDAIQKGFVKAKVVDDPSSLDIDPANRVVIDRVENLKRKMKDDGFGSDDEHVAEANKSAGAATVQAQGTKSKMTGGSAGSLIQNTPTKGSASGQESKKEAQGSSKGSSSAAKAGSGSAGQGRSSSAGQGPSSAGSTASSQSKNAAGAGGAGGGGGTGGAGSKAATAKMKPGSSKGEHQNGTYADAVVSGGPKPPSSPGTPEDDAAFDVGAAREFWKSGSTPEKPRRASGRLSSEEDREDPEGQQGDGADSAEEPKKKKKGKTIKLTVR